MATKVFKTKESEPFYKGKLPQILSLVFLLVVLPALVFAIRLFLDTRSSADQDPQPSEIIVSNITDTSVTISFLTDGDPSQPSVLYGPTGGEKQESFFDKRADTGQEAYNMHYHVITNLSPETEYEFGIKVGNTEYPTENLSFNNVFSTLGTSLDIPTPQPVNGLVSGDSFVDGVVYAHLSDGQKVSNVVSAIIPEDSGAYSLDLGAATLANGTDFDNATEMVVFASVAGKGRGFAKVEPGTEFVDEIVLDPGTIAYDPLATFGAAIVPSDNTGEEPAPTPDTDNSGGDQTDTGGAIFPTPDFSEITPEPTPEPTTTPEPTPEPTPTSSPQVFIPPPQPSTFVAPLEINVDNGDTVPPGAVIRGTSAPSASILITLNNDSSSNITANSSGNWQFRLADNINTPQLSISATAGTTTITRTVNVQGISDLPATSIEDWNGIIVGVGVLLVGGLIWASKRSGRDDDIDVTFRNL